MGEEGRFAELSRKFDRALVPVGEFAQGEFFIALDQDSVLYLAASAVFRLGPTTEGLERLIRGIHGTRLAVPG